MDFAISLVYRRVFRTQHGWWDRAVVVPTRRCSSETSTCRRRIWYWFIIDGSKISLTARL